jgi:hypothetical protein
VLEPLGKLAVYDKRNVVLHPASEIVVPYRPDKAC